MFLVASGFSIAGLDKAGKLVLPHWGDTDRCIGHFAMVCAARTIPLALVTMVAIYEALH